MRTLAAPPESIGVAKALPDDVYGEVARLSQEGSASAEEELFSQARASWQQAWGLLPEPPEQWEAATWLLTAIGDTYFLEGRFAEARDALQRAVGCPGGLGTPFLHLRLGQAQFELGNVTRAKDELARAFMGGAEKLFDGEDPKYWQFIRELLRPAADELGE